jgi:hypothetical protein
VANLFRLFNVGLLSLDGVSMTDRREQGKLEKAQEEQRAKFVAKISRFVDAVPKDEGKFWELMDFVDRAIEAAVAEAVKIERAVWEREFMFYAEVKSDTAECANKLAEHRNKIFESLCLERVAEAEAEVFDHIITQLRLGAMREGNDTIKMTLERICYNVEDFQRRRKKPPVEEAHGGGKI